MSLATRAIRGLCLERRERVGGGEVEFAVVAAQSACDERRDGVAEDRGVTGLPAEMNAAHEPCRKRVAAARSVDGIDPEYRNLFCPFGTDYRSSIGTADDGQQPCAGVKEPAASVVEVFGASEAEDLFFVGQQIVRRGPTQER